MLPTDVNQSGKGGGGRMGGCKPRIEVIVKMQKKESGRGVGCPVWGGWGGGGGQGVVNQELKLL